jgi:hypothetical protein
MITAIPVGEIRGHGIGALLLPALTTTSAKSSTTVALPSRAVVASRGSRSGLTTTPSVTVTWGAEARLAV